MTKDELKNAVMSYLGYIEKKQNKNKWKIINPEAHIAGNLLSFEKNLTIPLQPLFIQAG